jgi:hypothetical protein
VSRLTWIMQRRWSGGRGERQTDVTDALRRAHADVVRKRKSETSQHSSVASGAMGCCEALYDTARGYAPGTTFCICWVSKASGKAQCLTSGWSTGQVLISKLEDVAIHTKVFVQRTDREAVVWKARMGQALINFLTLAVADLRGEEVHDPKPILPAARPHPARYLEGRGNISTRWWIFL